MTTHEVLPASEGCLAHHSAVRSRQAQPTAVVVLVALP